MDGVNALIARGVAPPQYNVLDEAGKAQGFLARQQMMQMAPQNALLDRQLKERDLQLRELALDVQRRAAEAKEDGPVSIDYPTFSVKGNRSAVANVAAMVAQYPDQVDDPQFAPWLASQGVSIERPKEAPVQKTELERLVDARNRLKAAGDPTWQEIDRKITMETTRAPKEPPAPISVSPGTTLFDPRTNKAIYTAPQKPGEGTPKAAKELRDEFTKQSKTFVDVRDSYNRITSSAKDPSAAGDLAVIFNYMKMLDPESVVRESEFATAANSAGVPERIRAQYNKVLNGERLAAKTRADFVDRAKRLYQEQSKTHSKLRQEYERLAKSYGANPTDVIIDYSIDAGKEQDPYEIGQIYESADGKRAKYAGGGKWEPIQ